MNNDPATVSNQIAEPENPLAQANLSSNCWQQHILSDTSAWQTVLQDIQLQDKTVVELGSGTGVLTKIIKACRPKHVIAYEIDTSLTPADLRSRLDLREVDFTLAQHTVFFDREACLIASPPYNQLEFIRTQLIDRYQIRDVLLSVPQKALDLFSDFEVVAQISGSAFIPPTKNLHFLIKRGFEPCTSSPPHSQNHVLDSVRAQQLETFGATSDIEYIDKLIADLSEEIQNPKSSAKLGSSRRIVICLSNNPRKLPEVRRNLERYGVETFQAPNIEHHDLIRRLLQINLPQISVKAVTRETTRLYKQGSYVLADCADMEPVDHLSSLACYTLDSNSGAICRDDYCWITTGFIDQDRRQTDDVFGWDDIFVVKALQMSYQKLLQRGAKISSRDMVYSQYLREHLYYRKHIDLTETPLEQGQTIDFNIDVAAFVDRNPYLSNSAARTCGLTQLFKYVAEQGVFFRSPVNRREKNYWLPGLNAGIPLVPKSDPVHQITFMAHDFGHMLIPDLIVAGPLTAQQRRCYIVYRMLSEALTLVLADMLFVDSLARAGITYDYSKRKIYPLFKACGLELSEPQQIEQNLKKLLWANTRYCLRGDDSEYRKLLAEAGSDTSSLQAFQTKYMPFFVEDYRWTERNLACLESQAAQLQNWWSTVEPIANSYGLGLETTAVFSQGLAEDPDDCIAQCFERVYQNRIKPALSTISEPGSEQQRRSKAFARYMIGQLSLCSHFSYVSSTAAYQDKLVKTLLDKANVGFSLDEVNHMRAFFGQYVDSLVEHNQLQLDDALTYKQVHPLFEPFYVFYDEDPQFYEGLPEISERILTQSGN